MNELKNCPFCRGDCEMQYPQVTKNYKTETCYSAGCPDCGIWTDYCDTEEEAITAWNRRADGWIPATKELPNNGMRVIVCLEGGFVCEAYRKGEKWDRYKNGSFEELMGEYVTHWQPLPEPPEGVNRDDNHNKY